MINKHWRSLGSGGAVCFFQIYASLFSMTITLPVTLRDKTKSAKTLRANGEVPGVVYGPKQEPAIIKIDSKTLDKVLKEAGESTVIELAGLDKPIDVLVKDVSFDPVKQQLVHVDFYAMEKGKEMHVQVPLHFTGVAPIEEDGAGTVTKILHEVEVVCKPKDLPSHFDVDLSVLKSVEDKILISDLIVPAGVKIEEDLEESVAVVSEARQQEEVEESAEIDMSAIEVEQKGKTEEDEE